MATGATEEPILTGLLNKQGGQYRSWKKRYFVLHGTTLSYYKQEGDPESRGDIDLTTGRGVRRKDRCLLEEWPKQAKSSLSFSVATESRTYYLYGADKEEVGKWKDEIAKIISKAGKPTVEWKKDPEGKPEAVASKVARSAVKLSTKIMKHIVRESGLVDDDVADIVEGVADAVENQADASRDASIGDRLKMAAGDTAGVVGDNVDDPIAGVVCDVVKEQAEADDDVNIGQRAGLLVGTTLQGTSQFVPDEIGAGVMDVAGGIIHDQAEADADTSIQQRLAIGVGSTAAGVGDVVEDDTVKIVAKIVEKGAEKAQEIIEEYEEENGEGSDDDDDD